MNTRCFLFFIAAIFFSVSCTKKNDDDTKPDPDDKKEIADITLNWAKAWGTSSADDFAGSVVDNNGNLFFLGASAPDGYLADIFLVKVKLSDQTVQWAKSFDSGNRDYFPSPSENGHSQGGGGSRCIAADGVGNVYIAGTIHQGFNKVFCMKVSPDGNIVWQTTWKADNSGLARGSAKAYALDVENNRVFITGSSGAGVGTEESCMFLLVIDSETGQVLPATKVGIDPSASYNDRGYTIKATAQGDVIVAGWEGKNNSGIIYKFSNNGESLGWIKRVNIGYASRFTDIDVDGNGDIYLAADIRGVSTFIGIVKATNSGNIVWGRKFQGISSDRNNISCLRVIDNHIYVGGRGSFQDYDVSLFGDGCILKYSLSGDLLKQYNFFTGTESNERCGERIESIHLHDGKLILLGETWPEYSHIDGKWYIPKGTSINLDASSSVVSDAVIHEGDGVQEGLHFNINPIQQNLFPLTEGNKGSADVILFSLSKF